MPISIFSDLASSLSLILLGYALRIQLSPPPKPAPFPSVIFPFMPGHLDPPPPPDQPRIPVELIEDILDISTDSGADLCSISGASKRLAMRARPFLFKNIDILSFRRLIELSSLLSPRYRTIPTTADRLAFRFETPRPGRTVAYDSESVVLALIDVLEHFKEIRHTIRMDIPAVVSRSLDWTYLHRHSNLKILVLCGTYTWLPAIITALGHLHVLECLSIEAHFTCESRLEYYQAQDYLSPRLKEISLSPSTLRILRWMCHLNTYPKDLHIVRLSVDSTSSATHLLLDHLGEFLKKYQRICHLYAWFEDDDQDMIEGLGEALYFAPQLRQLELLLPGPLDEEEMAAYINTIRQYAWSLTEVRGRGGPQVGVDKAELWEVPSILVDGDRVPCGVLPTGHACWQSVV